MQKERNRRPGGAAGGQAAMAGGVAPAPKAHLRRSALGARRSALGARRSALGARRSALGARRSALGARRSALGARRSALGARRSALGARRSALGARRSALGARRSALGARRSALGARRSALGARRSALGARHCTASRSVPQCQPFSLSPPTAIHSALLLTEVGLLPDRGVHGRPAAIPTGEPTPLKPFRQWRGCGTAARPLSFDTCIRP